MAFTGAIHDHIRYVCETHNKIIRQCQCNNQAPRGVIALPHDLWDTLPNDLECPVGKDA